MPNWPGLHRVVRKINHFAGRIIHQYELINDGDSILVAVSGGKDSLVLIKWLADLRHRAPVKFRLGAAHLGNGDENPMRPWLETLGLDYLHWEKAPHNPELATYRPGQPSPCYLCAKLRRNRLFELARQYKASSLALGHHLDDAMETLLLNIFYSGSLNGLEPRQDLFEGRLRLIRPFFMVPESLIIDLSQRWKVPVKPSNCPADGFTMRQRMKDLVAGLAGDNPKVYGNLTAAVLAASSPSESTRASRPQFADSRDDMV